MALYIFLFWALFSELISKGLNHVGEPCNRIIRICLASHSYCDQLGICKCLPTHPVNVSPHSCKKGKRYGDRCSFSEECRYFDNNSYCTQLPYRSICECNIGYSYSETKQQCEELIEESSRSSNLILPTAVGLSLAFASILCCCLVLWHVCKRQDVSHWSFLSRNTLSSHAQREENNAECQNSFLGADEALPSYDTALSLKISPSVEEHEAPPSYEEAVKTFNNTTKI